jgi:uncharacterized protein (TIGR02996 family)
VARFQRGDSVLEVWIDDRLDGVSLLVQEGDSRARVIPTGSRYSVTSEYHQWISHHLGLGWRRVRDPKRERDLDDEPREPTFEAALAAAPDDAATALVYADWYQQQGHPRGALIATQCGLAANPADPRLQAEEAELFREWRDYLLGPLERVATPFALQLDLAWEHGFIRRARLVGFAGELETNALLWDLLRHPSARFLRELVLGSTTLGFPTNATLAADLLLRAGPTPPLRVLAFDDSTVATALGDLTGLGECYPHLEDVVLRGEGDAVLGELALPCARRFAYRTATLSPATLAAILAAPWPALEELELWFGVGCTAADVAPLFQRTALRTCACCA